MTTRVLTTAILAFLAALGRPSAAQQLYTIRDLGFQRFPAAINEHGTVVGHVLECYGCTDVDAFVDDEDGQRSLELPRGGNSKALGLNDRGDIVGWSVLPVVPGPGAVRHAVLWPAGKPLEEAVDLGSLDPKYPSQSEAAAIDDSGQIVGYAEASFLEHEYHVARWSYAPPPQDLGLGAALAINHFGDAVGSRCNQGACDGFLLTDGGLSTIGSCFPTDLNDSRQIVGVMAVFDRQRGCIYERGGVGDVGTLGGDNSYLSGIDNAGNVVGWAETRDGGSHAILRRDGLLSDLNDLIPRDGEWDVLLEATGLNERGQIIGTGFYMDGFQHGFVMTPIGDPATTTTTVPPASTTTSPTSTTVTSTTSTSTTSTTSTTRPGDCNCEDPCVRAFPQILPGCDTTTTETCGLICRERDDACAAETIPEAITRRLAAAQALDDQVAANPARAARLARKARSLRRAAARLATRAGRRGQLGAACVAQLVGR